MTKKEDELLYQIYKNWCIHRGQKPTIKGFTEWREYKGYDEDFDYPHLDDPRINEGVTDDGFNPNPSTAPF